MAAEKRAEAGVLIQISLIKIKTVHQIETKRQISKKISYFHGLEVRSLFLIDETRSVCANRYGFGLLNELLFIIVGQGVAKI